MVAAIDDAEKNRKLDQSTTEQILSGIAKFGNFVLDQSYAKGIGDLLKSAESESGIAQTIANNAQQLIPYRALLGWITRLTDDTQRQPDPKAGIIEKQVQYMMAQIPGLSTKVPARLDAQGNPIKNTNILLNAVSPLKVTTENPAAKSQYDQIVKDKQNNAIATQERSNLSTSSTPKIVRLANDKYAYTKSDGSTGLAVDEGAAKIAQAKDLVKSGTSKSMTVNGLTIVADPSKAVGYRIVKENGIVTKPKGNSSNQKGTGAAKKKSVGRKKAIKKPSNTGVKAISTSKVGTIKSPGVVRKVSAPRIQTGGIVFSGKGASSRGVRKVSKPRKGRIKLQGAPTRFL
jgi:hypothetical protein